MTQVITTAYSADPITITLDSNARAGYSAFIDAPSNGGGITIAASGGDSILVYGSYLQSDAYRFFALVTKVTDTQWRITELVSPQSLNEPLTEIYDVTISTTIDDAYWDDSVSEGGPRYTALDTALLANSPTPITLLLGGGSLDYYRIFDIVQTGVGAVTIAPDAGYTINGGTGSVVISAQWKKARVYFTRGTDFVVVLD